MNNIKTQTQPKNGLDVLLEGTAVPPKNGLDVLLQMASSDTGGEFDPAFAVPVHPANLPKVSQSDAFDPAFAVPVHPAAQAQRAPRDTNLTVAERLMASLPNSVQGWLSNPTIPGIGYIGRGSAAQGYAMGAAAMPAAAVEMAANLPGVNGLVSGSGQANPVTQRLADVNAQYEADRNAIGRDGADVARTIGEIVNPTTLLTLNKLSAPQRLAQALKQGAGTGAAMGALSPVADPDADFWKEKAMQAGVGMVGGAVATPAIYGLSRVVAPQVSSAWQSLSNSGVGTTIGQRLGGIANSIEEKAQSFPILGDLIAKARARALESWNTATLNNAAADVGGSVTQAGHGGVKQLGDILSDAFERGKAMIGNFKIDQTAKGGLDHLEQLVTDAPYLTDQGKAVFGNLLSLARQQIAQDGSMTAAGFRDIDSKLAKEAARYSGSSDAFQQNLGDSIKQLQSTLLDNAARANPEAAQLLERAKLGWAKLARIEGAAKMAATNNSATGVFTPAQLMQSIRASDQTVRDRATARGDALLQDWAQDGMKVLGNKVPNSGTFDRAANGAALAYMLTHPESIPAAAVGAGVGAAAYSPTGQKVLNALATNRPAYAQRLAEAIRKFSPLSGAAAIDARNELQRKGRIDNQ